MPPQHNVRKPLHDSMEQLLDPDIAAKKVATMTPKAHAKAKTAPSPLTTPSRRAAGNNWNAHLAKKKRNQPQTGVGSKAATKPQKQGATSNNAASTATAADTDTDTDTDVENAKPQPTPAASLKQKAEDALAMASGDGSAQVTDTSNVEDADADTNSGTAAATASPRSKAARQRQKRKAAQVKYVAMDCEMVGVGANGQNDMLARVSIVNKGGVVLLDKYVKPREAVTDYRTSVSGIRPQDIEHGEEFNAVQDEVIAMLQGKILVGHAIRNDLAVLHIKHPYGSIRDTSRYKPLCRLVANGRTPSLKRLTKAILGLDIQTGEHNSVEDARAAMNIYNQLAADWENYLQNQRQGRRR